MLEKDPESGDDPDQTGIFETVVENLSNRERQMHADLLGGLDGGHA